MLKPVVSLEVMQVYNPGSTMWHTWIPTPPSYNAFHNREGYFLDIWDSFERAVQAVTFWAKHKKRKAQWNSERAARRIEEGTIDNQLWIREHGLMVLADEPICCPEHERLFARRQRLEKEIRDSPPLFKSPPPPEPPKPETAPAHVLDKAMTTDEGTVSRHIMRGWSNPTTAQMDFALGLADQLGLDPEPLYGLTRRQISDKIDAMLEEKRERYARR